MSFVTACQANHLTLTPEIIAVSSETPNAQSTQSVLPDAPTTGPLCFTPIELNPIAFSPDSAMLVIKTGTGVQIFNLKTLNEENFLEAPQNVLTAALSTDGQTLAWALEDYTIQLVQVSDGKILNAAMRGATNIVIKLRFSPVGDTLFSASADGYVRIWDNQGDLLETIEIGPEVEGFGVSPDGTQLATVPFDGPVTLWDLTENKKVADLGGTGGFATSDAVFSPDGKYLAADLATGLYLWRPAVGKSLWDDLKNSLAVTFSPDSQILAYSNVDDGTVVLSSPDGGQNIRTLEGLRGPVWELIFSPDSSMLAATDGNEIRIWQVADGELMYIGKANC